MLQNAPRAITLGLPSGLSADERRFPLTPEGAATLVEQGVDIRLEEGAGTPIHYADTAYIRAGARVSPRAETLRCDIVVTPAPLLPADVALMRRGTLLVTLSRALLANPRSAMALMARGVNVIAADLIASEGHRPVADILHEIDGCASMALASAMLTDPVHGKGILLGGITGIVPCEVTIIGSGMGAIAAAHNALGLGAMVRMFDDDLYSLRQAGRVLEHKVIASSLHSKVLSSALRSADVIVITPTARPVQASQMVDLLKHRALIFDLTETPGTTFPQIPLIDLSLHTDSGLFATDSRTQYHNVSCRVPRTAAMALSNALTANFHLLMAAVDAPAQMPTPLRSGLMLFWGKCLNMRLAQELQVPLFDIDLLNPGN